MSSILDALNKLETLDAPPLGAGAPPSRPRALQPTAVALLVAFVAGAGLAIWWRPGASPAPGPPPATIPAAVPVAPPTAAVPMPPPPPPAASPSPVPTPNLLAAVAPRPTLPPPAASRARTPVPESGGRPPRAAAPALEAPVAQPPSPATDDDGVLPRLPAGGPHIQVSFLVFSPSPQRRTVALAIDGGSMVTLHEGESEGSLEVVRILPDRVHVRHAGQLFAVRARD